MTSVPIYQVPRNLNIEKTFELESEYIAPDIIKQYPLEDDKNQLYNGAISSSGAESHEDTENEEWESYNSSLEVDEDVEKHSSSTGRCSPHNNIHLATDITKPGDDILVPKRLTTSAEAGAPAPPAFTYYLPISEKVGELEIYCIWFCMCFVLVSAFFKLVTFNAFL